MTISGWPTGLCLTPLLVCAAFGEMAQIPFSHGTFSADEDCHWETTGAASLRMNAHYIAGPKPGEDRLAWRTAVRAYRDEVRSDKGLQPLVQMDYQGVRAWVRMAAPLAKAYDLKPGDALWVAMEARRVEGNGELCIAFDRHRRADDFKAGWTEAQAALLIPDDGAWHRLETTISLPAFDGASQWLRPIVGMDATHSAAKGRVQIRHIGFAVGDAARMEAVHHAAAGLPTAHVDLHLYDRADLAWAQHAFCSHFTFMYDHSIYDVQRGRYTLDRFLEDGVKEFGGYDAMVLWQAYPRLGFDDRNQFDMYRDMPGGLAGLRDLTRQAHEKGVKVFIDYNPWDAGTRREGKSDEECLADLIAAIEADGIFLDTMVAGSSTLRQRIDAVRPGVVFEPEGHPAIEQLGICSASWAQWLTDPEPPGLLHLKWIEPRHMQHQIRRWNDSHRDEIESAFFNGSGMLVWENIFGTYNPWTVADRAAWRHAVRILRAFAPLFASDAWEPFHPTCVEGLAAHRWPGDGVAVFTLLNGRAPLANAALLETPAGENTVYYDLWNGTPLRIEAAGANVRLIGSVNRMSGLLEIHKDKIDGKIEALLAEQRNEATKSWPEDRRNSARSVIEPKPVEKTPRVRGSNAPPGMAYVEGGPVRMKIRHVRRECGCYPDPGAPPDRWKDFQWGSPFDGTLDHDIGPVSVVPFFIDEAEVSNAEFKRFLDATSYRPAYAENFLKHWPNGQMPVELADHPVVYVDLDDARAYARWAGKRLPTEPEWHLAAQGTDGRTWPWGNEFDPAKCNMGKGPAPVRSLPEGRSPYGCYHMAGNVYEWTESERDDGHTRFAIVRGGSFYKAEGSVWYADGGPQPCTHHAKFLLLWPGLDRCATIGFRCVVDVN